MLKEKKERKCPRVEVGHSDIGKHKIEVSRLLAKSRAVSMCQSLNAMPSCNGDEDMFRVFRTLDRIGAGNTPEPGFIVKRKVIIGDKLQFLDGFKRRKITREKA